MIEVVQIWRHDFDSMENEVSAAQRSKLLASFVGDDKLTAFGKANEFVQAMPAEKTFLGYDGKVYPWIEVRREWAK